MKSYIEKRAFLCDLAESYLDARKKGYINISDGIMNSYDFDSISFLMLLALTYTKEEVYSFYSMDIEVPDEIRNYFIEAEYLKIKKLKQEKIILGKIILEDAKKFYLSRYDENDINMDEVSKNFSL